MKLNKQILLGDSVYVNGAATEISSSEPNNSSQIRESIRSIIEILKINNVVPDEYPDDLGLNVYLSFKSGDILLETDLNRRTRAAFIGRYYVYLKVRDANIDISEHEQDFILNNLIKPFLKKRHERLIAKEEQVLSEYCLKLSTAN